MRKVPKCAQPLWHFGRVNDKLRHAWNWRLHHLSHSTKGSENTTDTPRKIMNLYKKHLNNPNKAFGCIWAGESKVKNDMPYRRPCIDMTDKKTLRSARLSTWRVAPRLAPPLALMRTHDTSLGPSGFSLGEKLVTFPWHLRIFFYQEIHYHQNWIFI